MDTQALPEVLLSLFDTSSEGLWFMSDDNVVQFYNNSFYQQFALSTDYLTLDDWLALVHPEDRERLAQEVDGHQKEQSSTRVKTRYRVKNTSGRYLWIEATGVRVEYQGGFAMVGSHKNVSEEVFLNQYLTHMANHDSETGLLNRHQFLQNASKLNKNGWILVCCLTQLQQFQRRVGYDATGQLSSTLVSTLDDVLNLKYGLYRISADVFVVTMEQELDDEMACSLMSQIETVFQQRRICSTTLTSRLGLGGLPVSDLDTTHPLEQIFNLSEYTRLVCSPVTYTGESQRDIDRHFAIQDVLEAAIDTRQIVIALQPIVEASTGNLISFEALARWEHPELGSISPAEFIPIAERLGHIHALGLLVLEYACQYLVMFDSTHNARPLVNVNVSAHQLLKASFVEDVCEVVARFGVSPSRIVLELTESYLLDEDPTITTTLNELHIHDFKLSIDDFGAGMSAITSLFRLPLYQVKLDRALIHEAMRRDACLKLITHLCEFGRTHNISLVAEGIETSAMFKTLTGVGVPHLQGYCLYKPCAPEVWLEKRALV
ncbi:MULTISPECIES: GGDEF domain-containing phosphodiesterase [unclassified Vibrio]|uniref:GGDEF domain-containing phosphodiesterase n=1 Tax=unclassified Vibrio TaxID=2614977 RepID=UPI001267A7A4|nr:MULTISPECIES: EAL domain-containing protein [unclassified Vibrio]QFT35241.1 Phytochrome-like protein cph2 [Vibrio sp. THAF64]QGM33140.1 Phytochrome-like protein cph2 [Vibrio sp. THAF191d]QGN68642.1 Phytochrome-like protein cph2 [Vibrio sp. THAF191c]